MAICIYGVIGYAYLYTNQLLGRFPQKMQPGKPFLKQQQHNNA